MLGFQFKTLALIMIFLPVLASAEIYRWTDESGKVHYSDKKPPGVTAEKKAYPNVATPWRKVPRPERPANDNAAVDDDVQANGEESNVDPQSDAELSKDKNDKKGSKKTKRLKAKQPSSDADNSDTSEPVRLNKKDKSSSTPAKRAADIKETYKKAKEEYRKAN